MFLVVSVSLSVHWGVMHLVLLHGPSPVTASAYPSPYMGPSTPAHGWEELISSHPLDMEPQWIGTLWPCPPPGIPYPPKLCTSPLDMGAHWTGTVC